MNMSFMLAGSASTNPVLFTLAILLMLAWQVAGYWGLDRFLLPLLGAPWSTGLIVRRGQPSVSTAGAGSG
jgi:thiosulfate dehydrogenase [quinone] large subunit